MGNGSTFAKNPTFIPSAITAANLGAVGVGKCFKMRADLATIGATPGSVVTLTARYQGDVDRQVVVLSDEPLGEPGERPWWFPPQTTATVRERPRLHHPQHYHPPVATACGSRAVAAVTITTLRSSPSLRERARVRA